MRPGADMLDIGAAWPSVRARLSAVLRGRGVQAADVDDIVQDVAVRAMRADHRFESEEHLVAWCCRVGINLHTDSTRRQRHLSGEPFPERAANYDTASTVERRLALEVLVSGISELSDEERRLLFELEQTHSRREAVRLAVRRHRLRARLAALVEGMTGLVVLARRWLRLARSLPRSAKVSLAAAPVVAVALVLAPLTPATRPVATPEISARNGIPLITVTSAPAERAGVAQPGTLTTPSTREARPAAPAPQSTTVPAPKAVVDVAPAGVPVRVSEEQRPDDHEPLFCTGGGAVAGCVARPPGVPEHTLPSLP